MQQVTEQQILALAPNPAAASNGRKISQKGGFVRLEKSADDTFYLGECTGSGKSNYITTADYIDPKAPVFRCSCPSRQFPCKHSLALLYEMMAGESFTVCEIPEDILKKREKKQSRDAKAQEKEQGGAAESQSTEQTEKKKAASARAGKAARARKIKKQLEGLALTARLLRELLRAGLGTMGGTALDTYRQLSKQLGDYYLPGPQRILNRLILEIEAFQKDGDESHYEGAVDVLEKLWGLVKKSQKYLEEKLEHDSTEHDDNLLYEELGGVWKLSELEALGRSKADVSLIQAAFWSEYDEARKEYIDTGCWIDLESGEISMSYNYRPLKALKYVRQEDTVFGVAEVSRAVYYPGEGNLRVRWDGSNIRPAEQEDIRKLRSFAAPSLAAEVKAAKNFLKNAMASPMLIRLLAYEQIGRTKEGLTLKTGDGQTILLGDMPGMEGTLERLTLLPESGLLKNQAFLGAFYYSAPDRRIKLKPLSIVTDSEIVRLLY